MAGRRTAGSRRWPVGLGVLWLLAVPVAAVLGVLGLRAAGAGSEAAAVISAADALALAEAAATSSARPTPAPTAQPSTPRPSPPAASVVERRVPGAVLGLRCEGAAPVLVWAVPEPGWVVENAELEDGLLVVRLASREGEVRVLVQCADEVPTVVGAERRDADDDGRDG